MNKAQLVEAISLRAQLPSSQAEAALNATLAAITQALQDGEPVVLVGFGTFEARTRAARSGSNPKTGEAIEIAASVVPAFKPGKTLRASLR